MPPSVGKWLPMLWYYRYFIVNGERADEHIFVSPRTVTHTHTHGLAGYPKGKEQHAESAGSKGGVGKKGELRNIKIF